MNNGALSVLICIVPSTEPDRTLQLHTTPVSLLFSQPRMCVRTIHPLFLFVGSHQLKILPLYDPAARALFSLYGNVVRNTYVTPKLIRYNFTGRLRSSIYYLLLRRQVVGLPVGARRLTAAPTANQSAALPAPVIGFPRFSQLFLKSHATLFFPALAPLSFNHVARARCLGESRLRSRNNRPANERRLRR